MSDGRMLRFGAALILWGMCLVAHPHPHAESAVHSYTAVELRPDGVFIQRLLEFGRFHSSIQMRNLDFDRDGVVTFEERERYESLFVAQLRRQIHLRDADGKPIPFSLEDSDVSLWRVEQDGRKETHVRALLRLRLPEAFNAPGSHFVGYDDQGYLRYSGDLLVLVAPGAGRSIALDDVASKDPEPEIRRAEGGGVHLGARRFSFVYSSEAAPGDSEDAPRLDIHAMANEHISEQGVCPPRLLRPDAEGAVRLDLDYEIGAPGSAI